MGMYLFDMSDSDLDRAVQAHYDNLYNQYYGTDEPDPCCKNCSHYDGSCCCDYAHIDEEIEKDEDDYCDYYEQEEYDDYPDDMED